MWSDAIASNGFASCAGANKGLLGSQVADGGKQLLRKDGGKAHSEVRAFASSSALSTCTGARSVLTPRHAQPCRLHTRRQARNLFLGALTR